MTRPNRQSPHATKAGVQRRRRIGVLMWLVQEFGRNVLAGVQQQVLSAPGFEVEIVGVETPRDREEEYRRINELDGLVAALEWYEMAGRLPNITVPLVVVPRLEAPAGTVSVAPNPRQVAQLAVEHFHAAYLPRIAIHSFGKDVDNTELGAAFRAAADAFGLEVITPFEHGRPTDRRRGEAAWLRDTPLPVGVFCDKDGSAENLVKRAAEAGIQVPDQLAVLGMGNDPIRCLHCRPTLSSMALPTHEAGRRAARLLIDMIEGRPVGSIQLSPLGVVQRGSTMLVAIKDPRIARALTYLRQHAAQRITISDMVDELGLTRRSFQRRFKQLVGRTPMQELIRVRVELAKLRLAQSDASMYNVAVDCGFGDQAKLAYHFREHTGMTPTDYRRRFRSP